jgi:enterochelin esterase family protein
MRILRVKTGHKSQHEFWIFQSKLLTSFFALLILFVATLPAQTFSARLSQINSIPVSDRQLLADKLIKSSFRFPIIDSDTSVTFVYQGKATSMAVTGDLNNWQLLGWPMTRIYGTDFWYRSDILDADARIEYKFIRDGRDWILDSLNTQQVRGGFGFNSELRMPAYEIPLEMDFSSDIFHGTLSDTLIYSHNLNNFRKISLYLPPDYHVISDSFPIVIFHDGWDYMNYGRVPQIIDNLIWEKKIQPIIAVFIPPIHRTAEYTDSLKSAFKKFIIRELWGLIIGQYRVREDPNSHAMIGASNGGNICLWIVSHYPDLFKKAGVQSTNVQPSLQRALLISPVSDLQIYVHLAKYDIPIIHIRNSWLIRTLIQKNYLFRFRLTNEGHNWRNWGAQIPEMLMWFFPS